MTLGLLISFLCCGNVIGLPDPTVEVLLLDGRVQAGSIREWTLKDGLELNASDDDETPAIPTALIDQVTATRFRPVPPTGPWRAEMVDGSVLHGLFQDAEEAQFLIRIAALGLAPMALDRLRRIDREGLVTPASRRWDRGRDAHATDEDVLSYSSGDVVRGSVVRLTGSGAHFDDGRMERTVAWSAIESVSLAAVTDARRPTIAALVALSDGSVLAVSDFNWRRDGASLVLTDGRKIACNRDTIAAVEMATPRRVWLSELEPARSEIAPYFDKKWPPKGDANAIGGPLVVLGRAYRRGVGLHSACVVSWNLDQRYTRFRAGLAVDDSAGSLADADARILLDGKLAIEHRGLRVGQKPRPVDIDLTGRGLLTIEIGLGANAHVQDRVDLLDARLIVADQ